MQRSKKIIIAAATAALAHVSTLSFTAQAATFTWNGAGGDDNLSTGLNWVGGVAPSAATDILKFSTAGAPRTTPNVGAATSTASIQFLAGSPQFNIGGSALTLGTNTATTYLQNDTVGVNQTFGAPVSLGNGTVNMAAGGLVFNGATTIGNNVTTNIVNVIGNSTISFAGGLATSASTLTFGAGGSGNDAAANFNGLALFSTDNSAYTGWVNVNGGVVRLTNAAGIGNTGTIHLQLSSGGTGKGMLELDGAGAPGGGMTISKNVITRARSNIGSISLSNVSGNNTLTNVFTGSGGSTFSYNSSAGNLSISNWNTTATGTGRFLILSGAGNGDINNWTAAAAGTVTVIKSGAGKWTLGSTMNNVNGTFVSTTVSGGTLTFGNDLGVRMFGSATVSTGGAIQVLSSNGTTGEIGNGTTPTTVNIKNGGVLDAQSFTRYNLQLSQTFIGGGTVKVGELGISADNIVHVGDVATSSAGTLTVQGNLNINRDFTDAPGAAGGIHLDLSNTTTMGGGVNDLIDVSGNLTLSSANGNVKVFVTPTAGAFANGSYRVIKYGGALLGGALNLDLIVGGGGTTRQSFSLDSTNDPGYVDFVSSGAPANITWTGTASTAWDIVGATNWTSTAPSDPNKYYEFDQVTFNDNATNKTIDLNVNVNPGAVTVNTAATYTIQGSGSISGVASLTKNGTGTLIITNSGSNTFTGAVNINTGTVQIGSGFGDGMLGTGSITNNGALVVNKSSGTVIPNAISGTGAIYQRSSGALVLSGSNSYTGATTIEGGAIQINNGAALGDVVAGTTVNSGGQLFATTGITLAEPLTLAGDGPTAGDGALRSGGSAVSNFNGPITLTGNTTFKVDGGATMNLTNSITGVGFNATLGGDANGTGNITGSMNLGTGGVTKNGAGTWVLASPSISYSGPTAVNGGALIFGNGTAAGTTTLPTGAITVSGGTVAFNNPGANNIGAAITGNGGIGIGTGGGSVTLTGNLTGFTGILTTLNGGTNSTLIVPVATGATGILIPDVNLTGVGQGIIRLTNSNAVANNATIDLQVSQAAGTGRIEVGNSVTLNFGSIILHPRNNATPTILALDGNNVINGDMRVNTGGSSVNFSANANASLTFTGVIRPAGIVNTVAEGDLPGSSRALILTGAGNGTMSGSITNRPDLATTVGMTVVKNGTGTWRLTGSNDYIGNITSTALPINAATIVQNGTLTLVGAQSQTPVFSNANTNAFTDVQGGRLTFEGGTDAATVNALLATSFASTGGFNNTTAKIRSTTSVGTLGLGMTQAAGSVTVGYTVFGDANLDGNVNALDFNALAANYSTATPFWYRGDFNYDGAVNSLDFTVLSGNFGLIAPTPTAAPVLTTGLGTLVPEPTSAVALLGLGSGMMRRRRGGVVGG